MCVEINQLTTYWSHMPIIVYVLRVNTIFAYGAMIPCEFLKKLMFWLVTNCIFVQIKQLIWNESIEIYVTVKLKRKLDSVGISERLDGKNLWKLLRNMFNNILTQDYSHSTSFNDLASIMKNRAVDFPTKFYFLSHEYHSFRMSFLFCTENLNLNLRVTSPTSSYICTEKNRYFYNNKKIYI